MEILSAFHQLRSNYWNCVQTTGAIGNNIYKYNFFMMMPKKITDFIFYNFIYCSVSDHSGNLCTTVKNVCTYQTHLHINKTIVNLNYGTNIIIIYRVKCKAFQPEHKNGCSSQKFQPKYLSIWKCKAIF